MREDIGETVAGQKVAKCGPGVEVIPRGSSSRRQPAAGSFCNALQSIIPNRRIGVPIPREIVHFWSAHEEPHQMHQQQPGGQEVPGKIPRRAHQEPARTARSKIAWVG